MGLGRGRRRRRRRCNVGPGFFRSEGPGPSPLSTSAIYCSSSLEGRPSNSTLHFKSSEEGTSNLKPQPAGAIVPMQLNPLRNWQSSHPLSATLLLLLADSGNVLNLFWPSTPWTKSIHSVHPSIHLCPTSVSTATLMSIPTTYSLLNADVSSDFSLGLPPASSTNGIQPPASTNLGILQTPPSVHQQLGDEVAGADHQRLSTAMSTMHTQFYLLRVGRTGLIPVILGASNPVLVLAPSAQRIPKDSTTRSDISLVSPWNPLTAHGYHQHPP